MRLHLGLRRRKKAISAKYRLWRRRRAPRTIRASDGIRLNLGCGEKWIEGWVNIDLRRDVADVVCDIGQLPFPDACAIEIRAENVLEHVPRVRTQGLLSEWRRVLMIGGRLHVQVPNMGELARIIIAEENGDPDSAITNVYGGHLWGPDGAWDAHHWGWTAHTITRDLTRAGYRVIENDLAQNMMVSAEVH